MSRTLAVAVVCIALCLNGCSLTYKKRVIKDADIGQTEILEYGLFGIPGTDSETPGGVLPLYRSETPVVRD